MTTREAEPLDVFGLRQSLRMPRRTLHVYRRSLRPRVSYRVDMVTIREPDLALGVFGLRQSLRLPRRTLHVDRRPIGLHVSHRANMITICEPNLTSNVFGLR